MEYLANIQYNDYYLAQSSTSSSLRAVACSSIRGLPSQMQQDLIYCLAS